jgi:metal-dependent amidase/aminoacylase/carboxypeptidase family protein
VTEKFAGTGVVGELRNGPGPTLLIRTDMDALPVKEDTGLPYASEAHMLNLSGKDVPVMHACGHDLHMTVFVGTARMLAAMKDKWSGTLVLVGQPAEEFVVGASDPEKLAGSRCTGVALPALHSSRFSPVPEPTIKTGVEAMSAAALDILTKN